SSLSTLTPPARCSRFPYTTLFRSTQFLDGERVIMVEREIKPQLHQAMVELGTPVCETLAQTHEELSRQRRFIIDLAAQKDLAVVDRKSTRLNSSHVKISYAVFCLK